MYDELMFQVLDEKGWGERIRGCLSDGFGLVPNAGANAIVVTACKSLSFIYIEFYNDHNVLNLI